jgi:hypothetical protein
MYKVWLRIWGIDVAEGTTIGPSFNGHDGPNALVKEIGSAILRANDGWNHVGSSGMIGELMRVSSSL